MKSTYLHRIGQLVLLLGMALLVGGQNRAQADSFTTFNLTGTFSGGAILSGTMTVDTTAGTVPSAFLTIVGPPLSLNPGVSNTFFIPGSPVLENPGPAVTGIIIGNGGDIAQLVLNFP